MLRIAFFILIVLALTLALRLAVRFVRGRRIDWTGVIFIIGFVALAFWLRHASGWF